MNDYNEAETDSQIKRTNQWLPVVKWWGWGKIGEKIEVQTTRCKTNQIQGCNVQHREYSQYFTITLYGV